MKATREIMGMPITIEAVGDNVTQAVIEEVFSRFQEIDDRFSTYKPGSEISRLNFGTLDSHDASEEVRAVLDECARLARLTRGYFKIRRDGMIDPSGYVKGWAIYQAARLLDRRFITRYCIDAGGDMQIRGEAPTGGFWKIGITHPFQSGKLAKLIDVKNAAVATSGTYLRGGHILNPITGLNVTDPVSLTVIGAQIDQVDALANAAICMGEDGLAFVQQQRCEAVMITQSGKVLQTLGFRRYEHKSAR